MTDKEFDLKMRSLLGDAEVPAPDGVWEAVRAQIPAVKPARKAAPWWWAGAGLAAAAAVALALVLGGTFRRADSVVTTDAGAVLAQNETVNLVPEAPAPVTDADAGTSSPVWSPAPVTPSAPALRVEKKAPQPVLTPKQVEEETPAVVAEGAATDTPATEATAAASDVKGIESASTKTASGKGQGSSSSVQETTAPWSDPFARMAYEDAHAKTRGPVSIDIRGLVGTNDKATATAHGGRMATSPVTDGVGSASTTYITEEGESRYDVPISFGVGVKFYLADRFAIGTGVDYSIVSRSFPGSFTKDLVTFKPVNSNIKHTVHYVGIPVNFYYDFLSTDRVKAYGFAGGSLEKGIIQKYTVPAPEGTQYWKKTVPGLQGSAALGLGVQFNITDEIGVYVDPSARYYFGKDQPKSIRTQQNVMFNLELGVRFDL